MKILITGGGGREHALAWKLSQNRNIDKIFCAPGNGATELLDKCVNVKASSVNEILDFALMEKIDLTIPGAEDLLVQGIVDLFEKNNLAIFGPDKSSARLEGSKSFAKDFMKKYQIHTAAYETFTTAESALEYVENAPIPLVVKADGLAAGKGVLICHSKNEAKIAIKEIMVDSRFGEAGSSIVIEEFLEGIEASILSIFDRNTITPFISAKDHKKINDGELGLNTGGMGAIAPNPYVTDEIYEKFIQDILIPTTNGLKKENLLFSGVIFFGLMITDKGVYLLEYNLRLGDPETQAVLPLLESDLLEIFQLAMKGILNNKDLQWSGLNSCAVVKASGGYPLSYEKGHEIKGLSKEDLVFVSGAEMKKGKLYTSGGRVLTAVGLAQSTEEAIKNAYDIVNEIHFHKNYNRKDIGKI